MKPDPITVSVVQHRLECIVREMGEAMLRTAYSQILNSSRDFSTAVFDGAGRLAAQAEHVPIHVGALPWAVASVADFFKGRVLPGDLFLLNDPYHGNNHLPDHTVLLPVFVGERLVFWSINRAHQHDIGGEALRSASFRRLKRQHDTVLVASRLGDFGAEAEGKPLLLQDALELLGDFRIHARRDAV